LPGAGSTRRRPAHALYRKRSPELGLCAGGGVDLCGLGGFEVFAFGGLFGGWLEAGLYELFVSPELEFVPLVFAAGEDGWPATPLDVPVDVPLGEAFRELLEFGGVNGRNPSLDFVAGVEVPPGRLAGVDGTRASCGDMAGAWYSPPAARAGIADRLLKSPARAVAATAGRPWFTEAKFS
jgi:hypothetical protein